MGLINFLLFVVIGCGVGFLGGLFGVGGGFVLVPILILSLEHSGLPSAVLTHVAIGTSLFVVVFTGIASAYQHKKQGNMDWRTVYWIGISSAVTALATTRLAAALSGQQLKVAFALIIMTAAIRMLTESRVTAEKKLEFSCRPGAKGLLAVGLTTGVVSALAGIGGGVFSIPLMYHFLKMPLRVAIGSSSAAIVITSLFSVTGYILNGLGRPGLPEWSLGFVDLQRGVALAMGTMLMARVGAVVSYKTHPILLRKLFALFVILVSLWILLK
jgi:hypothetical protein